MLEYLVVPIEWKAADDGDENTLVGYASTFGNVDLGGDVVVKGAFTKSVETIKAGNGIPLLADHVASTASVLGTIYDAEQDGKGLKITARISKAPSAQDTAVKLREGHLSKLSIGYESMDDAYEDRDGMRVRLLKDIKLWETSVVVFPMNPKATISRVKTFAEGIPAAERKALADMLHEAEAAVVGVDSATMDASATGPSGEPLAAPPAVKDGDIPNAGGEPAAAPGEGATGYDKYASRAILAGRPVEDADPVKVARLRTQLQLNETALAELVPPQSDKE